MDGPRATRIAVLTAGVVLATVACMVVGLLLDRTLRTEASSSREGDPPRVVAPASVTPITATDRAGAEAAEPRP